MTIDARYADALAYADRRELDELETAWRKYLPALSSTALIATMGQRVGRKAQDSETLAELAETLYSAGQPQLALKTLYRLPRQERVSRVRSQELATRIEAIPQVTVSTSRNARVVLLYEHESDLELLTPLLHGKLKRKNVPLPPVNQSRLLVELQELADQHLSVPNTVLLALANAHQEEQVLTLSRLSDSPVLFVQLDTVAGTATQERPQPFIPTGTEPNFPTGCWIRYSLSRNQSLEAWDTATGASLEVGTKENLLSVAVAQLLARQVILHDVLTFASAPLGTLRDQPAPLTRWFNRDLQDSDQLGVVQAQILSSLLEYFWTLEGPSDQEEILRSRLELKIANVDPLSRDPQIDLASQLGHRGFIDQLNVRSLWVQNDFSGVSDYVEWMGAQPDPETLRIADQASAAVELERLLSERPATLPDYSDRPEHIVCFLHASVPQQSGGYAIRAHGILTNLAKHGIHVTAITRPGYPEFSKQTACSDTVDGIEYHRLPGLASYSHGEARYMLECVDIFKEQLIQRKATKVHVRSTYLIAIPAIIAAHQLGLKIMYEVSGLWELVYQELESAHSLHKRAPFGEYWETLAVQYADEVLTMNAPMTELLVRRGAPVERVNLAPNAVDTQKFTPSYSQLRATPRIGYIGSIVPYENLTLLVRAAKALKDEGLRFDVRIIGDGNAAANLRALVKKLGVDDVVSMPGRIPHQQVGDEYAKMDIMVYPRKSTLATDIVTPLKPFEALAMGKAVVVSDIPPLREISGDGSRALLFEPENVGTLTEALRTLLQNWQLRDDLGRAGRAWVEQERSWSSVVTAFVDTYAKL